MDLAAVLFQPEGTRRRVVAYANVRLDNIQRRYHANELECFALVWACRKFRAHLDDHPFTLRTDSKASTWQSSMRDAAGKLARWAMLLQEFSFNVEHCPEGSNELPDALSRLPANTGVSADTTDLERLLPPSITPTGTT